MSAQWFYMKPRWFRTAKTVGPISESDLLHRIDAGKILPSTMLRSCKTREKWVPMSSIKPALIRWRKHHPDASLN
ncbi:MULTISPECIES: DUF4339 domain-containing protein [Crateriforma]|uniref:GYF domain-containing protein n=1 Tax=Crateriforma conspicua TaxID=2527996 RepID=A0A5C5Y997_9PLAN|nr:MULTISPECIES: DUF4339 domain-containing protein [Crateriforma]QDV61819.1 hypothetical protein Mal65_09460 [Crateriforma conspicua]TWT71930.1 hypothetical protein Pan14r_42470 [Crateriforma conspicua]TWU62802.1 hypothetical protein V7x_45380 [Crateriforma conspicua]